MKASISSLKGASCPRHRSVVGRLLFVTFLASITFSLPAATLTWDADTVTTGAQDGAGNWTAGGTTFWNGTTDVATANSTATDIALFGVNGAGGTVNVSTQSINGLIFSPSTVGYSLIGSAAGQVLTVGNGGITMQSGAAATTVGSFVATSGLGITMSGSSTFKNDSSSLLTLTGAFVPAGTMTFDGTGNITVSASTPASNSAAIIKSGAGTMTWTSDINTTGAVTVNAGILNFAMTSGSADFGTMTINNGGTVLSNAATNLNDSLAVTINSGGLYDFRVGDQIGRILGSGTITNGAASGTANLQLNSGTAAIFDGLIQDGATAKIQLTKNNINTVTLTGTNTFTGGVNINRGGLVLDFNATAGAGSTSNIVAATNALVMAPSGTNGSASLTLNGAAGETNSQTFASTAINAGSNTITLTPGSGGTMTANLSAITVATTATLNFNTPATGASITTTSGVTALMGANVTYTTTGGATTFAKIVNVSGTNYVQPHTPDFIYATSTNIGALSGYSNSGIMLLDNTSTGNTIQATGTTTFAGMNYTDTAARTMDIGAGNVIQFASNGGIIADTTAGNLTIGTAANSGSITAGSTGSATLYMTELNSTSSLTVNSTITNNAGAGTVSLVKTGPGKMVLTGSNTYSGTTTLDAGALEIQSATALGTTAGNTAVLQGAELQVSNNITFAEPLNLAGTGVSASGALRNLSGNNTVQGLVTISGSSTIGSDAGTLTFDTTSGNALSASGNINVTFAGAGNFVINDPVAFSNITSGTVSKTGTGTLTLNSTLTTNSTSGSAVNVGTNGGTLALGVGGGIVLGSNTTGGVTINTGGTFAITPGVSGTTNTISANASGTSGSLSMAAGSTLTMNDGATSTLSISKVGAISTSNSTSNLKFDIGGTTTATDLISITGAFTGGGIIGMAGIGSTPVALGNYNLITATSGLGTALFTLGTPNVAVNGVLYGLSLSASTGIAEILTVSATPNAVANAYWTGDQSSSWSTVAAGTFDTNFATSAAGTYDPLATPTAATNVFMTANTATNLTTTLDANFNINALTFTGTGTADTAGSTIASGTGTNSLTINATSANGNTAGNGITVAAGSGANTISANVVLGASQTWTTSNTASNANALTVSGNISDGGSAYTLTKAGAGNLTLSGNNTYSGGTILSAGTTNINSTSAIGTGRLTLNNGSKFDNTSGAPIALTTNNPETWTSGAATTFVGTNALNLGTGAVNLAGSFTLTNTSTLSGTSLTIGGNITPAAASTLTIAGTGSTTLSGNIIDSTVATSSALTTITVTASGTTTLSGTSTIKTLGVNGGPSSIIDLGSGTLTIQDQGSSGITSSTGGTINGGTISLGSGPSSNNLDNGAANGKTLTINSKITGPFGYENYVIGNGTGVTVLTSAASDFPMMVINSSIVSTSSMGMSGSASPLGTDGVIDISASNTTNPSTYRYTGTGETTNKGFALTGTAANGRADLEANNASGLLKITGNVTNPGASTKSLDLIGTGNAEISGVISNYDSTRLTNVAKSGTGTWALSGVNTYTGATSVTNGTLQIGVAGVGSTASGSAVTVNGATAVLAGSGTINGATTITSGTIKPGDSAGTGTGTLTINNTLNITSGGALNMDIAAALNDSAGYSAAVAAGTVAAWATGHAADAAVAGNDKLKVTGALTLAGTVTVNCADPSVFTYGDVINLMDWASISGFSVGGTTSGTGPTFGSLTLPTLTNGNWWDVSQFMTTGIVFVVPEPSRAMLLLTGLTLVIGRRRRS